MRLSPIIIITATLGALSLVAVTSFEQKLTGIPMPQLDRTVLRRPAGPSRDPAPDAEPAPEPSPPEPLPEPEITPEPTPSPVIETPRPAPVPVRVLLVDGSVVEGMQIEEADGRLWIEVSTGRLGIEMARIARVDGPSVQGDPSAASSTTDSDLAAGEEPESWIGREVRVHLPGGTLRGVVEALEGTRLTLRTNRGGRVVLRDADWEPVAVPTGTRWRPDGTPVH